ncbi:hypothetical protein RND81_11G035500 [Saponaria officinalis]|uniref:Uncharacterized protein n=1 Tax=Saponaria officinalis TaxID=3572 RepID=A0AAW1HGJ0_SAPOF
MTPLKQQEALDFLRSNRVDCGAIIETHIKVHLVNAIHKRMFKGYSLATNYDFHYGGRIWVLWNPTTVSVRVLDRGAQFIHCSIIHLSYQLNSLVTFVYSFNRASERLDLWSNLQQFSVGLPWVCLGDFNVSLNSDERVGFVVHEKEMQEFQDCLCFCSLVDHPYTGGVYTWHNKQDASPKWPSLTDCWLIKIGFCVCLHLL